ncbi:hypothetical protein [Sulfuracidifex metallicus]|uniref:Uncharacterized protein n=1 Tax=Sulfuracidifex metallicus DSM 6482 = JCM 9184 TaxID=523847 RepID=A0A6A9QVK0_SULME|nr:hypothetical protein [Sulfuracidifex metallicus]MUN29082.1 hypothetical protein [Sulfuracidifex metallicus DSM 6482 = JCM 9184]WOE50406.1 hypothetical protein RQ359_001932 [Sulfuracidifex metallicus DSM 6482 = JCM 9184]
MDLHLSNYVNTSYSTRLKEDIFPWCVETCIVTLVGLFTLLVFDTVCKGKESFRLNPFVAQRLDLTLYVKKRKSGIGSKPLLFCDIESLISTR